MNEETLKKFRYQLSMPKYIAEISHLSLKPFSASNLVALDIMEEIRQKAISKSEPKKNINMQFEEKSTKRFKDFIQNLYSKNQNPIYIWTELSNDCGIYEINSILEFNFDFSFDINDKGLIHLLSINLKDEMILDFSNNYNEYELEVELCGPNWIHIDY
ncbi:hypothetical protein [Leptospira ainlahdjerensis]|nr:hypothetical protein [Leptospira ainlahdjerensis]